MDLQKVSTDTDWAEPWSFMEGGILYMEPVNTNEPPPKTLKWHHFLCGSVSSDFLTWLWIALLNDPFVELIISSNTGLPGMALCHYSWANNLFHINHCLYVPDGSPQLEVLHVTLSRSLWIIQDLVRSSPLILVTTDVWQCLILHPATPMLRLRLPKACLLSFRWHLKPLHNPGHV